MSAKKKTTDTLGDLHKKLELLREHRVKRFTDENLTIEFHDSSFTSIGEILAQIEDLPEDKAEKNNQNITDKQMLLYSAN